MDLLLGLDVGTTATKALLLDVEGNVIAEAGHSYKLITPREGWVEQDPEDLWQGVIITTRAVLEHIKFPSRLLALSISSQGGTTIPVDDDCCPVSGAISWMDHRAHEQADCVRRTMGEDRIYKVTGWRIYDGLPLLHICWLRQCAPEIFAEAKRFLFVNDFILHRLTGQLCMDPSSAGITQLYNIAKGDWDRDMLEIAGIKPEQLSPVKNSGTVVGELTSKASAETGLSRSVLVVNGAHDQYCAALGAGVIDPGDVMLSCGTAWVVLGVMDKLKLDPEKRLSVSPHVIENRWGALKSMGAVGTSVEWLLDNLWSRRNNRTELYEELNRCAISAPVGARGLIFLPPTGGYGHSPRGAFIGLSTSHSRGDMSRAIMEGIGFDLRWTMEDIRKSRIGVRNLRMVGGATSSPIWPKIVADITGLPVIIPSVTQSASYGACILAGIGSGVFPSPKVGYKIFSIGETCIAPNEENLNKYDELFEIYRSTFQQIQDSLFKLSKL